MLVFSDTSTNTGLVQQTRKMMGVDATQWPTANIVASCNNYLDTLTGYAIGADKRFQWDSTNHSKLPEGTSSLTIAVSDYSFLTDEQGNRIITLTGISKLNSAGTFYEPLTMVDRNDTGYDPTTFGVNTGTPSAYDKIADNIIRLDMKPPATVASGLKFFFQRSPYYYVAADTTRETGFAPMLDRGFVIASAYDGALTLGLPNLQALGVEMQREQQKMVQYFTRRNNDDVKPRMTMRRINYI